MEEATTKIEQYLLEKNLYNSYPLQKFKEHFPTRFRESADIRKIYKSFMRDRTLKRNQVIESIREELPKVLENALRSERPEDQSLEKVVEAFQIKEKELRREIRLLEEIDDNYLKYFKKYLSDLEQLDPIDSQVNLQTGAIETLTRTLDQKC